MVLYKSNMRTRIIHNASTASYKNLLMPYVNSNDDEQTAHRRSLFIIISARYLNSLIDLHVKYTFSKVCIATAAKKIDLKHA